MNKKTLLSPFRRPGNSLALILLALLLPAPPTMQPTPVTCPTARIP